MAEFEGSGQKHWPENNFRYETKLGDRNVWASK
jgi:hypothetical protein